MISNRVKAFTLFNTIEQNDAFLELLNFADDTDNDFPIGDGSCENLRRHSKVTNSERDGEIDPPCLSRYLKEHVEFLRRKKLRNRMG